MNELDELLQAAVAPWDEKSWERLCENYPRAAAALGAAVARALTEQQVRDYCARWGYPEWVGHWLAQAVTHLRRQAAEAAGEPEPQPEPQPERVAAPDGPTAETPPRPRRRIAG
jgi:hypothetical protein